MNLVILLVQKNVFPKSLSKRMCRKEMFDNQRPVKCSDRQGKGLVQIKSVRIFKELIRNSRHKNFIRFQPLHPLSEN